MSILSIFRRKPKVAEHAQPNELARWATKTVEKIRTATIGGSLRWTPYFDNPTRETQAIRDEYLRMLVDPVVKSSFYSKVYGVASQDWQIHAYDEENPSDQLIAKFVRYNLDNASGGVPGMVTNILATGGIMGYSINEKVWKIEERGQWKGKRVLAALKPKEKVAVRVDEFRNIIGVDSLLYPTKDAYDQKDFIIYSHMSLFDNPTGTSDFRAIFRSVWMKKQIWNFRGIHLEKWTGPFLKGTYPNGQLDVKEALGRALAEAKSETWMTIPASAAVDVIASGAGTGDYQQAIKDLNEEIMIGIEGAFLHGIGGQIPDGRGNASVSRSRSEIFQWMLSTQVSELMNKQLFPEMVDANFPLVEGYPRITFGMISEAEMVPAMVIDEGLQRMGFPLSKKELAKKYGRTQANYPNDTLTAVPTAVPGTPGLPGPRFTEPAGGPASVPFDEQPAPTGQAKDEVALAGSDGKDVERLLSSAKKDGIKAMAELSRKALTRFVGSQDSKTFFDDAEKKELSAILASTLAPAELLGRSRVREMAANFSVGKFSERGFQAFDDKTIRTMTPQKALEYFKKLTPSLKVAPELFGRTLERDSFTLAVNTDEVMLKKIQKIIADRLETGEGVSTAKKDIEAVLDKAGVLPDAPGYSQMVFRTNTMESYSQGVDKELKEPDMMEAFPVWQYLGIADGRQGADHEPRFDKYYPNEAAFAEVRGPRLFSCRCVPAPVWKDEWKRLQDDGAKVETEWAPIG